jgi:hypothetical protein
MLRAQSAARCDNSYRHQERRCQVGAHDSALVFAKLMKTFTGSAWYAG